LVAEIRIAAVFRKSLVCGEDHRPYSLTILGDRKAALTSRAREKSNFLKGMGVLHRYEDAVGGRPAAPAARGACIV
jgi:hypothetical protein